MVYQTLSSVISYIEPLVWLSSEFANDRNGMKEGREKFKSMVVKINFRHCNLYCIITAWNKHVLPFSKSNSENEQGENCTEVV